MASKNQIVDYSQKLTPGQVVAAGWGGAQRYLPKDGPSSTFVLSAHEVATWRTLPVGLAVNFESLSASWMAGGHSRGVAAGKHVAAQLAILGLTDIPVVYASADFHPGGSLPAVIECLRGFVDVLGAQGRGVYGFVETLEAARHAGLADYFWLCGSRSGLAGRPWITLYQHNNDNSSIAGITVDVNDVLNPHYGQLGSTRASAAHRQQQQLLLAG